MRNLTLLETRCAYATLTIHTTHCNAVVAAKLDSQLVLRTDTRDDGENDDALLTVDLGAQPPS